MAGQTLKLVPHRSKSNLWDIIQVGKGTPKNPLIRNALLKSLHCPKPYFSALPAYILLRHKTRIQET